MTSLRVDCFALNITHRIIAAGAIKMKRNSSAKVLAFVYATSSFVIRKTESTYSMNNLFSLFLFIVRYKQKRSLGKHKESIY